MFYAPSLPVVDPTDKWCCLKCEAQWVGENVCFLCGETASLGRIIEYCPHGTHFGYINEGCGQCVAKQTKTKS